MASMAGLLVSLPAAAPAGIALNLAEGPSKVKQSRAPKACGNLGFKSSDLSGTALGSSRVATMSSPAGSKHGQAAGSPGPVSVRSVGGLMSNIFGCTKTTTVDLKATVVLTQKNWHDWEDNLAEVEDAVADLVPGDNSKVEFHLVSDDLDSKTGEAKLSDTAIIENWVQDDLKLLEEDTFTVTFKVPTDFGVPGAFLVRNGHPHEFFLRSLVLELPDKSKVTFACNSAVYNYAKYSTDRIFFSNKAYLPSETPAGIKALRDKELQIKRGDGLGEGQKWERIYDYAVYDDLSRPDTDPSSDRPVLGGSTKFPYPRRCRTGRPHSETAPQLETNVLFGEFFYVPRDELFSREKASSFEADVVKDGGYDILAAIENKFNRTPSDFDSFEDIKKLYVEGPDLTGCIDEDKSLLKYPVPDVFRVDEQAWSTDQEFARQYLAGLNPIVIERVQEYPPKSSLDANVYGPGTALTDEHILPYLEGLSVTQAVQDKRLFTVDYHDILLPFLEKQNTGGSGVGYAPRTIFFLTSQGTLKPIAIELALDKTSRVFTAPSEDAKEKDHLWELAKIHANTVDFGYQELVSHWLQTHAVMEPIIIAANRQLSANHPIYILLLPHFRDTMNINALARQFLINANGIIENTFTPGKYSMEISSVVYGAKWRFDTQALPNDLIARGMAEPADSTNPGGVKLLIEDYPYAKDGLELWDVIKNWVGKYVGLAYKNSDEAVKADTELQAWWKELVEVGNADLKGAAWWPKLDSLESLTQTLSTIIWIAGPQHAAVNFGQYGYAGYMPNRPSQTRKLVPEPDSEDYKTLQSNPEKFLLDSVSTPKNTTSVMTTIEILSTHAVDEEYVGQRQDPNWTSDSQVLALFQDFSKGIDGVAASIQTRNKDKTLLNRWGPAKVAYTLLYPFSAPGLTGQGVPNSTCI